MSERARCSFVVHCLLHAVVLLGRGNLRAAERWLGDAQRMVDAASGVLAARPGPRATGSG